MESPTSIPRSPMRRPLGSLSATVQNSPHSPHSPHPAAKKHTALSRSGTSLATTAGNKPTPPSRGAKKACLKSQPDADVIREASKALAIARELLNTRCPLLEGHEDIGIALPAAVIAPTCPSFEGFGPVQCVRKLGKGGFGEVWLGRRMDSNDSVAVKFLAIGESDVETNASDVEREVAAHLRLFGDGTREAPACRLLLALAAHCLESDRAVLVLELFEGVELLEYVSNQPNGSPTGWLVEAEARPIVRTLLEALAHMHACGVAHLDLKPQNVLIHPPSGNLKLIDYGTAGFFEPGATDVALRLVEENGGTESYQGPERILDDYIEHGRRFGGREGFDGPAADIFSLGCLAFFLLRGKVPFDWEGARARSSSMALERYKAEQAGEENPWAGVLDPLMVLIARCKANDPFGKDEIVDEDDEEDEEDDERPPPSAAALEFVRRATRYEASQRPAAEDLATDSWLLIQDGVAPRVQVQQLRLSSLEAVLGELTLD
jgi:serine/threonine protein kinase